MKFNGWLSFFIGLLEFTETLGHYPFKNSLRADKAPLTKSQVLGNE